MTMTQIQHGKAVYTRWAFSNRAKALAWGRINKINGHIGRLRQLADGRWAYGARMDDEI